jgi:CubicO group peptidase (beta-lactamase class C family)
MKEYVEENHFNGTILVARENIVIFNDGYGYAKRFFGKKQNLPDTKFILGSMTKTFTAQVILSLQAKNMLSMDDPVTKYYPDYQKWKEISTHNLLNHTSGIENYYNSPWAYAKYFLFPKTPEKILSGLKDAPLHFDAGKDYEYSNTNYIILSGIIEKASGKSYIDYLNENIFEPIGLSNTGYSEHPYKVENMAKGYCANMVIEINGFNLSNLYGAGGLYSTTEDVYKFLQAIDEERLLNEQTKMHVRDDYYYGYGLMLEDSKDYGKIYFHTGGGPGINTGMYKFADLNLYVIILGNNMQCDTGNIAKDIAGVFIDK